MGNTRISSFVSHFFFSFFVCFTVVFSCGRIFTTQRFTRISRSLLVFHLQCFDACIAHNRYDDVASFYGHVDNRLAENTYLVRLTAAMCQRKIARPPRQRQESNAETYFIFVRFVCQFCRCALFHFVRASERMHSELQTEQSTAVCYKRIIF